MINFKRIRFDSWKSRGKDMGWASSKLEWRVNGECHLLFTLHLTRQHQRQTAKFLHFFSQTFYELKNGGFCFLAWVQNFSQSRKSHPKITNKTSRLPSLQIIKHYYTIRKRYISIQLFDKEWILHWKLEGSFAPVNCSIRRCIQSKILNGDLENGIVKDRQNHDNVLLKKYVNIWLIQEWLSCKPHFL